MGRKRRGRRKFIRPEVPITEKIQTFERQRVVCPYCSSTNVHNHVNRRHFSYYYCQRCTDENGRTTSFKVVVNRSASVVFSDGEWKGRSVFVFGCGPSAKEFDFRKLRGSPAIAADDSWRLFAKAGLIPRASLSTVQKFWDLRGKDPEYINATSIRLAVSSPWDSVPYDCYRFDPLTGDDNWSDSISRGLRVDLGSEMCAVNLADALGADSIFLVGFDMNGKDMAGAYAESRAKRHRDVSAECRSLADSTKAKIYNLSPSSLLDAFAMAG